MAGAGLGPWARAGLGPGIENLHNSSFNERKQMLDTPFCREFRSALRGSSEIIQIQAKMKVGWKSLNSQRQATFFRKIRSGPACARPGLGPARAWPGPRRIFQKVVCLPLGIETFPSNFRFSLDLNYFTASTQRGSKFCAKWRV